MRQEFFNENLYRKAYNPHLTISIDNNTNISKIKIICVAYMYKAYTLRTYVKQEVH